jgi:hypothetical protein
MIIGVDLATAHFELAIADAQFEIQQRKRLSRNQFAQFCRECPPSFILMDLQLGPLLGAHARG